MSDVIHIAGNLVMSNVHREIIDRLDKLSGIKSTVIVPTKSGNCNRKADLKAWRSNILFIETPHFMRYFPIIKIVLILFKLLVNKKIKIYKVKTYFGHSIWSDGALCYILSLISKSNYFLFMRNTDYNIFFKIFWLKPIINKIINHSTRIFVPTKTYIDKVEKIFKGMFFQKFEYLPNAIPDFWHENINSNDVEKHNDIVFVGRADKNKNFKTTFGAASLLFENGKVRYFHVVGITVTEFLKMTKFEVVPSWVRVYGFISKEELLEIYRISKVMVLPSFKETFGLVYIEALSQKCRIICSKGQGISKDFINKPFLKVVEPDQINDIALKIEEHLLEDDFFHVSEELEQFKWDFIVKYLYKQCFREN